MLYSLSADLIAFLHAVITSLIWGPVLLTMFRWVAILFGFDIKWNIPVWLTFTCFVTAFISIVSYTFSRDCVINPLEKWLRQAAGQEVYQGSFIAHQLHKCTGLQISRRVLFLLLLICGLVSGLELVRFIVF